MIEHARLHGGPASGRRLTVKDSPETITVSATDPDDPGRPRRRSRAGGKRNCRYRRTARGVGTGLIPRRYEYVP